MPAELTPSITKLYSQTKQSSGATNKFLFGLSAAAILLTQKKYFSKPSLGTALASTLFTWGAFNLATHLFVENDIEDRLPKRLK